MVRSLPVPSVVATMAFHRADRIWGTQLRKAAFHLAFLVVAAGTFAHAAEPVWPKLTERLKTLLSSEMQHISDAMGPLTTAIATGDHETAQHLGIAIRDSFILKKALTPDDKQDLLAAVPAKFVDIDKEFHRLANKLAGAAARKDSELQEVYLSKMLASCIECHRQFAQDIFPGFADPDSKVD